MSAWTGQQSPFPSWVIFDLWNAGNHTKCLEFLLHIIFISKKQLPMLSSSAGSGLFFSSLSLLHKHLTGVLSHFMTAQYHYIVPVFITWVKLTALTLVIDRKEKLWIAYTLQWTTSHAAHISTKPNSKFESWCMVDAWVIVWCCQSLSLNRILCGALNKTDYCIQRLCDFSLENEVTI